ncbi:MAG: PD40 domain-containing protein [Candidatus Zixiibacteriota bacterium]|nr:MAG: PD40 domain-containing protein [candidate division Zixibacteria bacterium]
MVKTKSTVVTVVICLFAFVAGHTRDANNTSEVTLPSDNRYLGQKPPGTKAELFAPEVIKYETHDAPLISQDETWLVTFAMEGEGGFYKLIDGKLSLTANPLNFDIPQICNGMAFSASEDRVYFLVWENGDENFYYIERQEDRWTPPKSLGEEVNSFKTHWQFSVAVNENLYFSSEDRILVSRYDGDSHLRPVPLMLEDGSGLSGSTPFIAPDESYIIFSMDEDMHISYNMPNGKWTTPQTLGDDINSESLDLCPRISPNGKYLFFVSRRNGPDFLTFWADASFIEDLRPKELE